MWADHGRLMKQIWTRFALVCSLLAGGEVLSGGGIAQAAIKAGGQVFAHVLLDTGGVTALQSVAGLGFADSAGKAGRPTPTPVDVWLGLDTTSEGFTRARDYLSGKSTAFPASVQFADLNLAVKQVFNLGGAAITELEFAGADAGGAKTRPTVRMRLQPESLSISPGSGTAKAGLSSTKGGVQGGNFRVSIGGAAAPDVVSVSPWLVRRSGANLQISGLAVTVPFSKAFAGEWLKWSEDTLRGNPKADQKTLVLEYLDPALKNTLMTFEFSRVSLTGVQVPKLDSGDEQGAIVTFQLSAGELQVK